MGYPDEKIGDPQGLRLRMDLPPHMSRTFGNIYPIKYLSPYQHDNWTIKARLTHISDMNLRTNDEGERIPGSSFTMILTDDSGTIGARMFTAFDTDVQVQMLRDMLEDGKFYYISGLGARVCFVKSTNPDRLTEENEYEIVCKERANVMIVKVWILCGVSCAFLNRI